MPAATSLAIAGLAVGIGTTAASMGASFGQAAKQKKAAQKAQEQADKAFTEARKKLEVNYYKGLGIQKEPYELEREALAQSGAQAMEAARETERGVAATAGRVQMAQNQGQRQIAGAMGQELTNLEMLTAQEDSRLRDAQAQLDLEQAAGAQDAAAQAEKFANQATQQGIQGAISIGSQIGEALPLYGKSMGAMAGNRLENNYNKLASSGKLGAQYLDASGKALPFQQAYAISQSDSNMQRDIMGMKPDAFKAYLGGQQPKALRQLGSTFSSTPSDLGGVGGFAVQGLSPTQVAAGMNMTPKYSGFPMANMAGAGSPTIPYANTKPNIYDPNYDWSSVMGFQ